MFIVKKVDGSFEIVDAAFDAKEMSNVPEGAVAIYTVKEVYEQKVAFLATVVDPRKERCNLVPDGNGGFVSLPKSQQTEEQKAYVKEKMKAVRQARTDKSAETATTGAAPESTVEAGSAQA